MGLEVLQQEGVGLVVGVSADRVFREGAIADIILFACGLWERSQSRGGVKGGGLSRGNNAKTVHPSEKCIGWF